MANFPIVLDTTPTAPSDASGDLPAPGPIGSPLYSNGSTYKSDALADLKFNSSEAASESSANTFDGTAFEAWNIERTVGVQFTKDYLRVYDTENDILIELNPGGALTVSSSDGDKTSSVSLYSTGMEFTEELDGATASVEIHSSLTLGLMVSVSHSDGLSVTMEPSGVSVIDGEVSGSLTATIAAALEASESPSGDNPFATIADLSNVLVTDFTPVNFTPVT